MRRWTMNWSGLLLPIGMGAAGGLLSGLLGIGGGVIMVPMLIFFLACNQKEAQGLSLGYMPLVAFVGFLLYGHMAGVQINVWVAILLTAGGVAGAYFGTTIVKHIPNFWLRKLFAVLMVFLAFKYIMEAPPVKSAGEVASVAMAQVLSPDSFSPESIEPVPGPECGAAQYSLPYMIVVPVVMGVAGGILSSLLGIGGGVVMVPMLSFFMACNQKEAQGLSLGYIIITALVGFFRYHRMKHVETDFKVVGLLSIGGVLGILVGTGMVAHTPPFWLRKLFAVLMLVIAVRMLLERRKFPLEIASSIQSPLPEAIANSSEMPE